MLNTQNYRFYPLQKELHFRRLWLLRHNQKFREEFEALKNQCGREFWPNQTQWPLFNNFPFEHAKGNDYPPLREFYARYGLGTSWPEYSVIKKFGERPFGIEIVGNPEQPVCLKLVLWLNEINKKNVSELWPMVEKCKREYFTARDVPWSLEFTNFWRDADWYNQYWLDAHWHGERRMNVKDIVLATVNNKLLTIHFLFLEWLMKQHKDGEKSDLLSQLDPNFRIINSSRFTLYSKITKLLYAAGILIIGNIHVDWGDDFPYQDAGLFRINGDDDNQNRGCFYIFKSIFLRNPHIFQIEQTEKSRIEAKAIIREQFLEQEEKEYIGKDMQMNLNRLINQAIKRMEKRIDSVV